MEIRRNGSSIQIMFDHGAFLESSKVTDILLFEILQHLKRSAVLERLAEIRNNPEELAKYNTPEWIEREVKASMKLSE